MISLANAMANLEEVVLVLPSNTLSPKHKELIDDRVRYIPYELIDYVSLRQNIKMIHRIVSIIRKEKPDVINIQANGHPWFWLAYPFIRKFPIFNTVHDPALHTGDQLSKKASWAKASGKRFSKGYFVHGEFLKEELVKHYQVDPSMVHVIQHGNLSIYQKWRQKNFAAKDKNFLFFGRIWAYKGLEYFIQAANKVAREIPDARFTIAGTGEDFDKYEAMIERPEQFDILNYRISEQEVDGLFQKCSMVVLPYIEATQSGVIPLAYAYNKPVIATEVGSLPEIVEDGETGFLVPPKSPDQIAEKMLEVANNESLYTRLQKGAGKFARKDLSWLTVAKKSTNAYKSAIAT